MWNICQCRVCNTADHRCCDWCWFVRTLHGLTCTLRAAHGINQSRISVHCTYTLHGRPVKLDHLSLQYRALLQLHIDFLEGLPPECWTMNLLLSHWVFQGVHNRVYTSCAWARAKKKLDDGWPESEKDVCQAALRMVVVKDSRWIVGEFYMSYGRVWCEKVRLIKKRILGRGHQMTRVLQPQRERGRREREKESGVERKHGEI